MTPKLMGLDWYGFFFILPSFLWLFQVSVVVVLLVSPMLWICKKSLAAKIVHIPIGLYFAWYCVRLPWSMDMEYGLLQWILALSFLGIILMIFGAIFFRPLRARVIPLKPGTAGEDTPAGFSLCGAVSGSMPPGTNLRTGLSRIFKPHGGRP